MQYGGRLSCTDAPQTTGVGDGDAAGLGEWCSRHSCVHRTQGWLSTTFVLYLLQRYVLPKPTVCSHIIARCCELHHKLMICMRAYV